MDAGGNVGKHRRAVEAVAARLRAMSLGVEHVAGGKYDLLVAGRVRVSVRVAAPGERTYRVKYGERTYRYTYRRWVFNFHHHGQIADNYTDVFVCVATGIDEHSLEFVIPWGFLSGRAFVLHSSKREYRGRYARCRDNWAAIAEAAAGEVSLAT